MSRPSTRCFSVGLVLSVAIFAPSAGAAAQIRTDPVKNDTLLLRNGDLATGEFRQLSRGLVTFKTDAMATVSVKWTRVLTAKTDKQFEINLTDGRRFYGGLGPSEELGRVFIEGESDTVEVAVTDIVDMIRIKGSFFRRMDGSFDLGANYTQQSNKVDLSFSSTFRYVYRRNRLLLNLDGSLTQQDSVADISRANTQLTFAREFYNRWFLAGVVSAEQSSQLSLDLRITAGAGPGRFWIQSNGLLLASGILVAYTDERFRDTEARNTIPVSLLTSFEFFNWAGLSTDLSSTLAIERVVTDAGRWRINFDASLRKELVNSLYLSVGVTEQFDSQPPAEGANKNDFTIRTSLGFTFF